MEYDNLYQLVMEPSAKSCSVPAQLMLFKLVCYMTAFLQSDRVEAVFLAYNVFMDNFDDWKKSISLELEPSLHEVLKFDQQKLQDLATQPEFLKILNCHQFTLADTKLRTYSSTTGSAKDAFIERCISLNQILKLDRSPYTAELGLENFFLTYSFNTNSLETFTAWYEKLSPEGRHIFFTQLSNFTDNTFAIHNEFQSDFYTYLNRLKSLYSGLYELYKEDLGLTCLKVRGSGSMVFVMDQVLYVQGLLTIPGEDQIMASVKGKLRFNIEEGKFIGYADYGLQFDCFNPPVIEEALNLQTLTYLNSTYEVLG